MNESLPVRRTPAYWYTALFSGLYLTVGGLYFALDGNFEFVIYIILIALILLSVFSTLRYTKFPNWMLWLIALWGLLHVLGGALPSPDGVLFSYRIYPFLDLGGDFYILKYDQVAHFCIYALVALMSYHVLRVPFGIRGHIFLVSLAAVLISLGVGSLNEIVEFLIVVNLERHGVGGYENAMLDLVFNWAGAMVASIGYAVWGDHKHLDSV